MFDIFFIGKNTTIQESFPFAKQVSDYDSINPTTKMYWVIEPNILMIESISL